MIENPIARKLNIIVQESEGELLVYDLSTNKAFCLNQTSALVYQLCDGKHSVRQISRSLSQKIDQPVTEDLIWLALDGLKKDNLLDSTEFEIHFNGLNRREIVKKIGFASMVMLPVISSIVAPNAAMAQSRLLANCVSPCTADSQCLSNACLDGVCSEGTDGGLAPGTRLGSPFGTTFPTCQALAVANCCSGLPTFFVTGNCFCA